MSRITALLVAPLTLWAGSTAASAQDAPPSEPPSEAEIVVEAPRALTGARIVGKAPYTGAPVAVMTLRIPVLYGDLDLADPADAQRLMTRVERVAQDACRELDAIYPLAPDPDCAANAMKHARPLAEARIAQARAGP